MKWAKAKTILICIFVVVNLFLFTIYKMNSSAGKKTDLSNVISILSGYNITAEGGVFNSLPKKMKQAEVKSLYSDEEFIRKLMGDVSAGENGTFVSGSKTYSYADGKAHYSDSAPNNESFRELTKHNAPGKFSEYLNSLGINKANLNAERVTQNGNDVLGVEISYAFDKKEIFADRINISGTTQGVVSFDGRLLNITGIKEGNYITIPSESVIIDYLSFYGEEYTQPVSIVSIKGGYFVSHHEDSVSSYAIPAYQYTFSDNKIIYLDARENIEAEFRLLK